VATNEDGSESILLLNDKGCPPDRFTFPAFSKASPNSKSLIANFRAFKFPNSLIVRFSVMVQFCPGTCPPVSSHMILTNTSIWHKSKVIFNVLLISMRLAFLCIRNSGQQQK